MQLQGCGTPTSITPCVRWQMQHALQLGVSTSLWKYCTSPGKCTEIAKRQVALMFCVLKIIFKRYQFLNVDVRRDLLYQMGGIELFCRQSKFICMKELLKLLLSPPSAIYFSIGSLYCRNENQLFIRLSRCSQQLEWYSFKLQYLCIESYCIDGYCSLLKELFGVFILLPKD